MNCIKTIGSFALLLAVAGCNPNGPDPGKGKIDPKYQGLVLNEIAAHEENQDFDTWVEVCNASDQSRELDGLGLFITDEYFKGQKIADLSGTLAPGERKVFSTADETLVTGISSAAPFTLVMGTDKDTVADSYEHKDGDPSLGYFASYQRLPDASGEWRRVTYSSKGKVNELFDLSKTKPTAVWAWGSHMSDLVANDGAKLKELKAKGYDHLLLNYSAFDYPTNKPLAKRLIPICDELGISVHAWLQAFYDGDWVSPIDDEKKAFKEEIFERIRTDAARYIEQWGVKGIHLDYIRFGGTAYKHNYTQEVNSINAVNRACREVRETCDAFEEGIVTSAALMPEANSSEYYGQVPSQMAKYIHILMPMIYRYGSYNMSDNTFKSNSNYFAERVPAGGGVSWSCIQTYDANTKGLSAEKLRRDIDLMAETKASGIVLFRYQLGTFPDVNDLWN